VAPRAAGKRVVSRAATQAPVAALSGGDITSFSGFRRAGAVDVLGGHRGASFKSTVSAQTLGAGRSTGRGRRFETKAMFEVNKSKKHVAMRVIGGWN